MGENPDLDRSQLDVSESQFQMAQWLFEVQLNQLERTGVTAQALINYVALSGALASPLLLLGLKRSWHSVVVAILLAFYLLALGRALLNCLRVIYNRPTDIASSGPKPLMHYRLISGFGSAEAFSDHVLRLSRRQQLQEVLDGTYFVASVVRVKADAMNRATRWAAVSLALLALIILTRAVGSIAGLL